MHLGARQVAAVVLFLSVPFALRIGVANASGTIPVGAPIEETRDATGAEVSRLDHQLADVLCRLGFTGGMESTLEQRLGRRIHRKLADLGRMLWFDTLTGLNDDNTCAGCHSPTNGLGDTQSIAIGIENNGVVGPHRTGPRNQRRSPLAINTAFYRNLMWNSRFAALSNDPFDNGAGFLFPPPEGLTLSHLPHLLAAQAFIPPSERNEVAGFVFPGNSYDIRDEVLRRLNATPAYRTLFGRSFPEVDAGGPITFEMFGAAIAEFEFTQVFTDTPLDRFARGERSTMTAGEKKGAMLFFGKAGCVSCHAVSGASNEMFSDFTPHVIGVPQIVPAVTNSVFDGPGANEDFGLEQVTQDPADRYKFRTAPLRNLAVMPAFMHNGCFTTIEEAVRHHLDVFASARSYRPDRLDPDLKGTLGPIEPVLGRVDPRLARPIALSNVEFRQLVDFLRHGLLDPRALPANLQALVPDHVPSGRPVLTFEFPAPCLASAISPASEGSGGEPISPSSTPRPSMGSFGVDAPYPNPARGSTSFAVRLPRAGRVSVFVHDTAGRRIRLLVDGSVLRAGSNPLVWDGRNDAGAMVSAGIYFLQVRSESGDAGQRIVHLGR